MLHTPVVQVSGLASETRKSEFCSQLRIKPTMIVQGTATQLKRTSRPLKSANNPSSRQGSRKLYDLDSVTGQDGVTGQVSRDRTGGGDEKMVLQLLVR